MTFGRIPIACIMLAPDLTVTSWNPAAERIFGYSESEILGRSFDATVTKDGRPIVCRWTNTPLLDADGAVVGVLATAEDITEETRAEEERRLRERNATKRARIEALATLAGGIAHDFNNILAIILTHATLLERKQGDPAAVKNAMTTVRQAVQRGSGLCRQILTFAHRGEIRAEAVNLAPLLERLAAIISSTFPNTVRLTLAVDPDLPVVSGDAGQLHQALLNLCVNAREAMPDGGTLTIEAHRVPAASMTAFPDARPVDHIAISVTDTGTGIAAEALERIFEPFFTTKESVGGAGLGLALVFGVAKNHRGVVDVDSRVGEGTTFRLYLPLMPSTAPSVAEQRAPREMQRGKPSTLLVIEDEPALREALNEQLGAHGFAVQIAESGIDALAKCKNAGVVPDAVVMDLGIPRTSPVDLVHALRAIAPGLPIVAMTGYAHPAVYADVIAAGVQKILQKPFEIAELVAVLREVL